LERLLDLFEEDFDLPPAAVEFRDAAGGPLQIQTS
jgi:hypothetical protein